MYQREDEMAGMMSFFLGAVPVAATPLYVATLWVSRRRSRAAGR